MDVHEHSTRQWKLVIALQVLVCLQNQQFWDAYVGECWTTARLDSSKNSGRGMVKKNRGCSANLLVPFCPCFFRLSSDMNLNDVAGISRSRYSKNLINSSCRLRSYVCPQTLPVRVSKAANRLSAPLRWYSCSTALAIEVEQGEWALCVDGVAKTFFIDTHYDFVSQVSEYKWLISWIDLAKALSLGTLGDNHRWCCMAWLMTLQDAPNRWSRNAIDDSSSN